ncbi:MAG: hypothetical protein WCI89_01220 [bacterium]
MKYILIRFSNDALMSPPAHPVFTVYTTILRANYAQAPAVVRPGREGVKGSYTHSTSPTTTTRSTDSVESRPDRLDCIDI